MATMFMCLPCLISRKNTQESFKIMNKKGQHLLVFFLAQYQKENFRPTFSRLDSLLISKRAGSREALSDASSASR